MTPEARLFAMTAILVFAGVACFGLAHFAVWRQRQLQDAAEREARATPESQPAPVSRVSVVSRPAPAAGEADRQTDEPVSAASVSPSPRQLDRTRMGIIYTLLRDGWTTSEIRPWLRGDNNTISAEIAEARKRLEMAPESREIVVRTHEHGHRVEREITL